MISELQKQDDKDRDIPADPETPETETLISELQKQDDKDRDIPADPGTPETPGLQKQDDKDRDIGNLDIGVAETGRQGS